MRQQGGWRIVGQPRCAASGGSGRVSVAFAARVGGATRINAPRRSPIR